MTRDEAITALRVQIKLLASAAADTACKDHAARQNEDGPLRQFESLARQLAQPALSALAVLAGEPQHWPDSPPAPSITAKQARQVALDERATVKQEMN